MWSPTKSAKYGVAICNFNKNGEHQISLRVGDTVRISEECKGWYRGSIIRCHSELGIFPSSYVHLIPCGSDIEWPDDSPVTLRDPIVCEVHYVLNEWYRVWKRLYMRSDSRLFDLIKRTMLEMIQLRSDMFSSKLVQGQKQQIKDSLTTHIDTGNKRLGLDLVPRVNGEKVNVDEVSPVQLYSIHEESLHNAESAARRDTRSTKKTGLSPQTHHLEVNVHSYECSATDAYEIVLGLYNSRTHRFITEKFRIQLLRGYVAGGTERVHNNPTVLFSDLGSQDLIEEVYLVVHVYRLGSLRDGDSGRAPTTPYRRPHGCGVLNIKDVLLSHMGNLSDTLSPAEIQRGDSIKIYHCSENEFPGYLDNLIRRTGARNAKNFSIFVSMSMWRGEFSLIKKQNPSHFLSMPLAPKIGFGDVISPDVIRNDLYITLVKGDFEKGSKSAAKNIEVRITILDRNGRPVPNCVSLGRHGIDSSDTTELKSSVFYHNNQPQWNEAISVKLPFDQFQDCHLRLEYRHCSTTRGAPEKKPLGFSFLKLTTECQTTICDGSHTLYVYKCDDPNKLKNVANYIILPEGPSKSHTKPSQPSRIFSLSERESVIVHTTICSTKLTQNVDLVGLLRWKDQKDRIDENLKNLMKADGEEIVKCLEDILNAVFNMFTLDTKHQKPIAQADLVFKALVFIFNLFEEKKFSNFKPVMDQYIQEKFSAQVVFRDMLLCLTHVFELVYSAVQAPSIQEEAQNCFKALSFISKCIIKSKQLLQQNQHVAASEQEKAEDLFQHLFDNAIEKMYVILNIPEPAVIKTQCILLENIPAMLQHFCQILPVIKLSHIFTDIIELVPKPRHKKRNLDTNKLVETKLRCIQELLNMEEFQCDDARAIVVPVVVRHLCFHFAHQPDLTFCAKILSSILNGFYHNTTQKHEIAASVIDNVLKGLVSAILDLEGNHPAKGHLVACFISIMQMMNETWYNRLSRIFHGKDEYKEFLMQKMRLFEVMISKDVFFGDWLVMILTMNSTILSAMQYIAQTLSTSFLQTDFDAGLWSSYFKTAVNFLTQKSLQLEKFSEGKKNKILSKYGDMRVQMGYEVISMWQNLGHKKKDFIPNLLEPFLRMTMVPQDELRISTLPIFYDMMESEYKEHRSLKQLVCNMADKVDLLISNKQGDHQYTDQFRAILSEHVKKCAHFWAIEGMDFIRTISSLITRLLDYRDLLDSSDGHVNKKMTCTVNLLHFYAKEFQRPGLYIRYIYKLFDMHRGFGNHLEAGFTLLLHADALEWKEQPICNEDKLLRLPQQSMWHRKEALLKLAMDEFHKGKGWEYGINICKKLTTVYENRYMFDKLGNILNKQAEFYGHILKEHRENPPYFKVGFYGKPFPYFLQNKEFVYRGREYERIFNFQTRLLAEFDKAEVLTGTAEITDTHRNSDKQYIQLCGLTPVPKVKDSDLPNDCSENVRNFHRSNGIDTFIADKTFHKGTRDKENDFKTLHLNRTFVKISNELPGILQWYEVTEQISRTLNQVEFATDTIINKNEEIVNKTRLVASNPGTLGSLTMVLNGVIDAAVSGGIAKYQEAFFVSEFLENNPSCAKHIDDLKAALLEQVKVLGDALKQHKKLASADILLLHSHLEKLYIKMKKSIRHSGSLEIADDESAESKSQELKSSEESSGIDSVRSSTESSRLVRDLAVINTPPTYVTKRHVSVSGPSSQERSVLPPRPSSADPSIKSQSTTDRNDSGVVTEEPPPLPEPPLQKLNPLLPSLPPKKRSGSVPSLPPAPPVPAARVGRSTSISPGSFSSLPRVQRLQKKACPVPKAFASMEVEQFSTHGNDDDDDDDDDDEMEVHDIGSIDEQDALPELPDISASPIVRPNKKLSPLASIKKRLTKTSN